MSQEITRGQLLEAIVQSTGDYDLALDILDEVTEGGKGSGRKPGKISKAMGSAYGSTYGDYQKKSLDKYDKRSKDRGRAKWRRSLNRGLGKVAKKAYNTDRAIARGMGAKGKGVARLENERG
jgi:hypothetical protein